MTAANLFVFAYYTLYVHVRKNFIIKNETVYDEFKKDEVQILFDAIINY